MAHSWKLSAPASVAPNSGIFTSSIVFGSRRGGGVSGRRGFFSSASEVAILCVQRDGTIFLLGSTLTEITVRLQVRFVGTEVASRGFSLIFFPQCSSSFVFLNIVTGSKPQISQIFILTQSQ